MLASYFFSVKKYKKLRMASVSGKKEKKKKKKDKLPKFFSSKPMASVLIYHKKRSVCNSLVVIEGEGDVLTYKEREIAIFRWRRWRRLYDERWLGKLRCNNGGWLGCALNCSYAQERVDHAEEQTIRESRSWWERGRSKGFLFWGCSAYKENERDAREKKFKMKREKTLS